MDKRERLEATIRGEPADRVPIALWRHFPGDDQRADDLAAAHVRWQKEYDWDFVKVSPADNFCLEEWGIEDRWEGNIEGSRRYIRRPIHSPDDWTSLKVLPPTDGGLGRQLECLTYLQSEFGDETPFIQTVFSPLAQARNLAGNDTLIRHMRQNAGQIHHALQTITDTTVRFVQEARKRGIAGIYYAVQHASYDVMAESEYEVFGRPYDLQLLRNMDDFWLNTLHIHGSHPMFNMVADYPNISVFNWHDRADAPTLSEGIKRIKGAASGGISQKALHSQNPEDALDQARDAFRQTTGISWIAGVGCVTWITTPDGNIRKLRRLVDTMKPHHKDK